MLAKRLQSLIPRMLQLYKKCFLVTQSMLNLKSGYKSIEDHSGQVKQIRWSVPQK